MLPRPSSDRITWRAIRGDDAKKIQRGAGHTLAQTTDIYIRVAEDIRPEEERQFATVAPFPALPEELWDGWLQCGEGGGASLEVVSQGSHSRRTKPERSKVQELSCVPSGIRTLGTPIRFSLVA